MTRAHRLLATSLSLALAGVLMSFGTALAQSDGTDEVATEPAPVDAVSTYDWEQLDLPDGANGGDPGLGRILAFDAVPGDRTLLHAWTRQIDGVRDQAVWSSGDGISWRPVKGLERNAFFANAPGAWIAAVDGRLFVTPDGTLRTVAGNGKLKKPKLPKKQANLAGFPGIVRGIVRIPEGLLVVYPARNGLSAIVSADGDRWRQERLAPGGELTPGALAAGSDGSALVAGRDADRATTLWVRSPDGQWSATPAPWDPSNSGIVQLGHAGGRYFVQASTFEQVDGQPRITLSLWTSPDGVTWETGPTTGEMAAEQVAMAVGPADGGVLIVTRDPADGSVQASWSADWETWTDATMQGLPVDQQIDAAVGRLQDGRVVLTTRDEAGNVSAWAGTAAP